MQDSGFRSGRWPPSALGHWAHLDIGIQLKHFSHFFPGLVPCQHEKNLKAKNINGLYLIIGEIDTLDLI
jgi:hypothetical protein